MGWLPYVKELAKGVSENLLVFNGHWQGKALAPSTIVFFHPPSICLNGSPISLFLPLPQAALTYSSKCSTHSSWLLTMGEALRSKQRRIYSFDPNTETYTTFSHKYMCYLLPALLKAANGKRTAQIEKIVRFEVDMALVLSTDEFKWSRALKHELEEGKKGNKLHISSQCHSKIELRFDRLQAFPAIPRPLVLVETTKKRVPRGEGGLACRIRILRRILPGGREMSVFELLSEVHSYVICLQLQVDILRSLVDAQ